MAFPREHRGAARVFADNLDVDWDICDLHELHELAEKGVLPGEDELGRRCLSRLNPQFAGKARRGDFIVAGMNTGSSGVCLDGLPEDPHMYGLGALILKSAGIAAVLCESAAANFQRTCIDRGLPVVECKGITGMVQEGDVLVVNLEKGTVQNLNNGTQTRFTPFPGFILEIVDAGGIYPYLERKYRDF